jgi:hypothetical protein
MDWFSRENLHQKPWSFIDVPKKNLGLSGSDCPTNNIEFNPEKLRPF